MSETASIETLVAGVTNSAEYWTEVEALFAEALDLEPAAQEALVNARTTGRPELAAEVRTLLEAHARAERVRLARPAASASPDAEAFPRLGVGSQIGPFRLVEAIGSGGMGTVYRAERADGGFEQQVAVKLIAASISHAGTARRFRAERQILASLRHPHIVTLLDGGVTPDGQAYLVMEYVEGTTIAAYCREHALTLEARLRLFRQVCSAVHYAHRHFVVHRDLKPANILITPDGVPKVLDFGVAKLLEDPETDPAATATVPGAGPLTPNYASPEQLRGLSVTTSSDVYALGVQLYELVAGARPYETAGKPLDEVVRLVLDTEPPRPSTNAAAGSGLPYEPRRALKGDIDAIVSRAMSKEPERRYGSADELGDDIGRFLDGKPIHAREPSLGYVVRKLASTHRAAFISAGVSLVLIVAALVVTIWQARVATAERLRAERRFNEVRELANTLIFKIHAEVAPLPGSTPVRRTIVAEALRYLERLAPEAGGDPTLQVELARAYVQIGRVQGVPGAANLGDREGAAASCGKAQAILEPLAASADSPVETVVAYVEATRCTSQALVILPGKREEARKAALEAVAVADALHRRLPVDDKVRTLLASANFTAGSAMDSQESLPYWIKTSALFNALLADRPDDPERQRNVALAEKYLGTYYFNSGDSRKALEHHQRARALDEQRLARDPTHRQTQLDVAMDLGNIAHVSLRQGALREGVEYYERSLAIRKALAASDPRDELARSRVGFASGQLARAYRELRDLPRALEHARAAVAIYELTQQRDVANRRDLASALRTLGDIEADRARRGEACIAFGRAFEMMATLDKENRLATFDPASDHLPALAERAAACGVKSAIKFKSSKVQKF